MAGPAQIRVAVPDDADRVEALLQSSYPQLMAPAYEARLLGAALKLMTRANPALLESGSYYLIAGDGDDLAACGGWTRQRPGSGEIEDGLGHIRHFATHPQWLGRGLGTAILERCRREAIAAGLTRFECFSSLNAEGFYAAAGFERERRVDIEMGPEIRLPAVLMYLDLSA